MTENIAYCSNQQTFQGGVCLFLPEDVTRFPPITPFQPTEELLPTERNVILGISILGISII